jgi:hypothetical protein
MSEGIGHDRREVAATASPSVTRIAAVGTALVAVNVVLMLVLSYTPVAELGLVLFGNYFLGIGVFVVTVGGGYWLANRGVTGGSTALAGAGVGLTQFGYGLFGATVLVLAPAAWRVPALGITAVVTGLITALVTVVVYRTTHDFGRWQLYSGGLFVGGFLLGAVGFFVAPALMAVAGLCFFLGFVADLTYEIWRVKEQRYASVLLSAIGIYVAVMGVFVHVLQWVLRIMSMLDQ